MKKSALSLLFAASAALPIAAFAIDNSDALTASFERGFDKGASGIAITTAAARDNDPLQQMINAALYSYSRDNTLQLLASFKQGFDKGPSGIAITTAARDRDPLQHMINAALYGRDNTPQLLASFERGFDKGQSGITITTAAARDDDPLQRMINAALYSRDNTSQLLASFERGFDKGQSKTASTITNKSGDPLWNIFTQANWGREYVALMLAAKKSGKPVESAAVGTTIYSSQQVSVN